MTIIAAFSHLKDSDDFKKVIENHIKNRALLNPEIEANDKNKIIKVEQDKQKLNEELKKLDYKRSSFSILLKTISVLSILGYTAYLGYSDYIANN